MLNASFCLVAISCLPAELVYTGLAGVEAANGRTGDWFALDMFGVAEVATFGDMFGEVGGGGTSACVVVPEEVFESGFSLMKSREEAIGKNYLKLLYKLARSGTGACRTRNE